MKFHWMGFVLAIFSTPPAFSASTRGCLVTHQVDLVFETARDFFNYCLVANDNSSTGSISLRLKVNANGDTVSSKISRPSGNTTLDVCVAERGKTLKFPTCDFDSEIDQTFNFR